MKTTEAACVSEELCRWKKKLDKSCDSRIERVRIYTRPFGYFKHVNS